MEKYIEYLKERKLNQGTDWKVKAYDSAIEALEKQMPKKPIQRGLTRYCPKCKNGNVSSKYCPFCGQKLDWN